MNLSCFFILQDAWGGRGVFVLSFVLSLALKFLAQQVTFCILLVRLEPVLPPEVDPIDQVDWLSFWSE